MSFPQSSYQLSWLVQPGTAQLHHGAATADVQQIDYTLAPELGTAWAEALSLAQGITLFHAVHALDAAPQGHLVPLMDVDFVATEAQFNAQVWQGGMGAHHEHWSGTQRAEVEIIAGPGLDTFRYHRAWRAKIFGQGGVTSEMFSIVIHDSSLVGLVGAGSATRLLDDLGLSSEVLTVVRTMPQQVSAPLRQAWKHEFTGDVRRLFAQARALDYLAGLLLHLQHGRTLAPQRGHRARIRELHAHLLQLEGAVPTLNDLARQFGLPAQQLNKEFSAEYGKSVFAFITEYRLEQARQALLQSDVSMKVLSARLGYSHVNHFISAFKRQFGYTPGSLRRG